MHWKRVANRTVRSVGIAEMCVLSGGILIALFTEQLPRSIRFGPFILSVLFLGLPHGAADHLVPARFDAASTGRSMTVVGITYGVLGGLYFLLWFIAPMVSFALFIGLTWFHWGQGDVFHVLSKLDAPQYRTAVGRVFGVFVRGGLPMGVPLIFFPDIYQSVAEYCVSLFGVNATLDALFTVEARVAVGLVLAIGMIGVLGIGWRTASSSEDVEVLGVSAAELGFLWVFFALVPPILAIGLYFCFWHALRHIERVIDGSNGSAVQFARDATPTTVIAVLLIAASAFIVPNQPMQLEELFGLYLVAIAVFTLPHVCVVLWMDYSAGLWNIDSLRGDSNRL